VEQAMLEKTMQEAAARGIHRLIGIYIPTAKNAMVADHYGKLGFQKVTTENGGQTVWEIEVSSYSSPLLSMKYEDRFSRGTGSNNH
jgi:predicted enzyme involved in methoxymalonyl-ACP biosynthesis